MIPSEENTFQFAKSSYSLIAPQNCCFMEDGLPYKRKNEKRNFCGIKETKGAEGRHYRSGVEKNKYSTYSKTF